MKRTRILPVAIAAVTLLAFALRVYHLDGQSLWYDEGFSVYLAQKTVAEITARTAADIQPPVYYYLLHAWMALAGHSEFAVRFLSVIFGTLTIPLVYHLARRLLNPVGGLLAALLLAVSPFHMWYAQETRMYTLVTMLGVLSTYLLLRLCRQRMAAEQRGVPALWLFYAVVNVLAIYTHYYAFFVVAFQAIYLLVWWLGSGRPRAVVASAVAALAGTALAYLPWAGFALNRYAVDESYWQGALSLDFVRKTLLAFATGHTVFEAQAQVITAGYVILAAIGVFALIGAWRDSEARSQGQGISGSLVALTFLLLYLIVPFVLLYLLSAGRPKFNPRYLMLASPPFFVLIAAGLAGRRVLLRAVGVVGLLYVLTTSAYALANNYTNHVYVRDDVRSVAARIAAAGQADEAVILCSGHMFPVYEYYASQDAIYKIPDSETLSTRAIVTYDVTDKLNEIAAGRGGLWLVLWQNDVVDPTGILASLLDAQAQRVPEANIYWGIELRHYRLKPGVRFVAPQMAGLPNVNFANKLSLIGMNLVTPSVTSGEEIALTLFWQVQQVPDDDYWVSLRLIDPLGHVVSSLNDRPAGYSYPTTRWQPQVTVPGSLRLLVMPATAPGAYKLQVIVFSLPRAQNLDVLNERGAPAGVSAIVGTISVTAPAQPPTTGSLGLANVLRSPVGGDMELVATSLSDRAVRQGETLSFAMAWGNSARVAQDYAARLRLTSDGKVLQEIVVPLVATDYPTSRWPAGTIVRSQYDLTIPADAPAQVQVQVGLEQTGVLQTIARLAVSQVARTTAVPAMEHTQTAQFGALARLLGYDLSPATVKPGEMLNLTLYWQAGVGDSAAPSYTVFTHLLGADQRIYGQHDRPPADGTRPTTGWLAGEIIVDKHTLVVKPEAPAGEYALEIGLYDPASDRRLEATMDGSRSDHVILATTVRVQR